MTQTIQFLNFDHAMRHLAKALVLREKKTYTGFQYLNNKRYGVITLDNRDKYLVLFKRDFFMKFGEMFKDRGETGLGESVNLDALKIAISRDFKKIVFVYEDGRIYEIEPKTIPTEGVGYKRETMAESKACYSFSIRHLKKFGE